MNLFITVQFELECHTVLSLLKSVAHSSLNILANYEKMALHVGMPLLHFMLATAF